MALELVVENGSPVAANSLNVENLLAGAEVTTTTYILEVATGLPVASTITFDNTGTSLTSDNMQSAIVELSENVDDKVDVSQLQSSATDNTADKVLLVGAFGLGSSSLPLVEAVSLNTVTVTGKYEVALSATDKPTASTGILEVSSTDSGNSVYQEFTVLGTTETYSRARLGGTWDSSWTLELTQDNTGDSVDYNVTSSNIDETPDTLLRVGARANQLDHTDSNIRFVPSVRPTLDLDFEADQHSAYQDGRYRDQPLESIVEVSRNTITTQVSPTGRITEIDVDEPRLSFSQGKPKGLGVYPSATNLATWSETNGSNYPVGGPSNWEQNIREIGEVNVDDFSSSVTFKDFSSGLTNAVTSIYFYDDGTKLAAGNQLIFRFECRGDTITFGSTYFDYSTKTFSFSTGSPYFSYTVEEMFKGFYRLIISCIQSTVTNITAYRVAIYSDGTYRTTLGGLQVETGVTYPSPYIKTEGSQVATGDDNAVINLLDKDQFNPEGDWTLFTRFVPISSSGSNDRWVALSDGTSDNRVEIAATGIITAVGGTTSSQSWALIEVGSDLNLVLRNAQGTLSIYINGVLVTYPHSIPQLLDTLYLGRGTLTRAASEFKEVKLYPTALTDFECEQLTK